MGGATARSTPLTLEPTFADRAVLYRLDRRRRSAQAELFVSARTDIPARDGHVSLGSKAVIGAQSHVRFTLKSGHLQCTDPYSLRAKSGHSWLFENAP